MASNYWIKLYHEILHDPKMGKLSDRLWRRAIEVMLLAGEVNNCGSLPSVDDCAWTLRTDSETLLNEFQQLAACGILTETETGWVVTHYKDRQEAVSNAERVRRYREAKQKETYYGNDDDNEVSNKPVTNRYIEEDIDKEVDKEVDKSADAPHKAAEILEAWLRLYPTRTKHMLTDKLKRKVDTRMKDKDFARDWLTALERGSKSDFLTGTNGEWHGFDLYWFLKDDYNWRKVLAGNYDNKGTPKVSHAPIPEDAYVSPDDFFKGGD